MTVAEARTNLPNVLRSVERGEPVEITRRGTPVAIVLSIAEYRRLAGPGKGYAADFEAWWGSTRPEDRDLPDAWFAGLRDRAAGRDVDL